MEIKQIPGLHYFENFISESEEKNLIVAIDNNSWSEELKRRVQHYGYRYNYQSRLVTTNDYLGKIPSWSHSILEKIEEQSICHHKLDQLIVNEYIPGQGIAPHVDCVPCFDDQIFSLSLNSSCIMVLQNITTKEKVDIWLEPRSLLCLTGEARYRWRHSIPSRLSDPKGNIRLPRTRRISMTFRKVTLKD